MTSILITPYAIPGIKRQWAPATLNIIPKRDLMNQVAETVLAHYKMDKSVFESKTTDREIIRIRNVIWSIMKEKIPKITLVEIGSYFGPSYNHVSVMQALKNIENDTQLGYIKSIYF